MNILFWTLQILLALHTVLGGVWKFTNPVQTAVPTLAALPNGLWLTLGVLDLFAAAALVLPAFNREWGVFIVVAALFVTLEMILYGVVHLGSGHRFDASVVYWLVVAAVSAFLAWGRLAAHPL